MKSPRFSFKSALELSTFNSLTSTAFEFTAILKLSLYKLILPETAIILLLPGVVYEYMLATKFLLKSRDLLLCVFSIAKRWIKLGKGIRQ